MIKLNDYKRMHWQDPSHRITRIGSNKYCFVCDTGSHPFSYHVGRCYLCNTCNTYLKFMNLSYNKDKDKEILIAHKHDSNRDLALLKMKLLNNISLANKKGNTKIALDMIADFINEIPLHYKVLNAAALCHYTATTHGSLSRGAVSNVFKYAAVAKLIGIEEPEIYEEKIRVL